MTKKKVIKIEKWIRRRFHKTEFFLKDIKSNHWDENRYLSLLGRLREWGHSRPWRDEEALFREPSGKGTSTPFSHYSSFDSLNTIETSNRVLNVEKAIYASRDREAQNAYGLDSYAAHGHHIPKSERTANKSKSCFSKSMSILDRARRVFGDAVDEESRLSRKRDVNIFDLDMRRGQSALQDVGKILSRDIDT